MGKILPTHNLFKPGAHPAQKKKEDHKKVDHKHEEHKHHETKADELKNRLKPIKIE